MSIMFHYSNHELAVVISVPIVTVLLLWTLVIFHKNKRRWRAYDTAVVAILAESVIRNASILSFIVLQKFDASGYIEADLCGVFVWLFNSTHTFHASCLTTLAVIGLFSLKLYRKQQSLKQYLTATHVIYHLFCLTTLCACVGVAAILARPDGFPSFPELASCSFMPYQLDMKFNAFIIVLHSFLAVISLVTFVCICCVYFRMKRGGFDYIKKSTSDLSELSLSTATPNDPNKSYYDTYTIQRNGSYGHYDGHGYNTIWKSDVSNVSTTVSSTNSRRPLNRSMQEENHIGTGLETIHPILVVCYLFYHLPIIVLCIFPHLVSPWSVSTAALWLGLLQDVLIPVGLGLVDSRFSQWVSKVYRCSDKRAAEGKLPHVGLDGKFRHFGSQPQSLETNQMLPERMPGGRCFQSEPKFPITNGSLYTSIDGRVPVIHNYRRHNNEGRVTKPDNILNLGLHSSNLRRQTLREVKPPVIPYRCTNCDKSHCTTTTANITYGSNSDLIRNSVYNLNVGAQNQILLKPYLRHVSLSQSSLRQIPLGGGLKESHSASSLAPSQSDHTQLRLSKSYDSLNDIPNDLSLFKRESPPDSDEEDYFSDSVNQNFDTISTQSSFSITTEANCDFEFYQNDVERKSKDVGRNFKIKRSNSKRSLENLQAYVEEDSGFQRSNSFVDRRKPISAEYSQKSREATFLDLPILSRMDRNGNNRHYHAGSAPDLKRIFISEYI